jgi:rubrerythrin
MQLKDSVTKENLLRAFAGECQAWRRYQFAASIAKAQKLQVLYHLFNYTSEQEKEHAEVFYNHLKEFTGQEITINANYPIDNSNDLIELLRLAAVHESEEHTTIYQGFGDKAKEEGFMPIANSFYGIAAIEQTHSQRFTHYLTLLQNNKLFENDTAIDFICLNCGHIHNGTTAPQICPVCDHDRGYYIRRECSPFES